MTRSARNLVFSGGVAHDYARTSPMVSALLSDVGIQSDITDDFGMAEGGALAGYDLVTLNCVRWSREGGLQDGSGFRLSEAAKLGLLGFLGQGKGLLALHAATICFDNWPEYRNILGAWWEWGRSGHAPHQLHSMRVRLGAHPIVEETLDFDIVDELYTDPAITDSIDPLVEAEWEGKLHPILWVRGYGKARVCYNALGHGPQAFDNASNRSLVQRGALWAAKLL